MASVSANREAMGSRSGGKIVRARRVQAKKTPYERPRLPNSSSGENPNWISRFIFSPTRSIASGAGKLLTSVFVSESSSSSSSSDGDSEDDVEDDVVDENRTLQGTEEVKKNVASEMVNLFRKDCPPERKASKRLIEQLLMQETFSRAERDKLFQIIEARVVESEVEAEGRLTEISNTADDTGSGKPAVCGTAILEAKKWLNEKRLGSSSKLEMDHGPCTLNSVVLSMQVADEDMGSPVDVAKSYMRARPLWASPSMSNFEFKSPAPLGLQLFKEETSSYSINGNSLSSSKMKRESPASGSWNIQEEIRRVRSKATEEMLRTLPSAKLDWSSLTSDYKSNVNSARADNLKIHGEDKMHHVAKSIDKSLNLSSDSIVTLNLSESKISQDVTENGTCLPTSVFLLQDKELETNPTTERKEVNSTLDDRECSIINEVAELANGFPPPTSLSGEPAAEHNHVNSSEELPVELNHVNKVAEEKESLGHDREATQGGVPVEEPCELSSEASIEVPNINENDTSKEENNTDKVLSEKNDTANLNTVAQPKPSSQSSLAGKTYAPRRGRRKN